MKATLCSRILLHHAVVGVAGHVEDARARVLTKELLREIAPAHPRHDDVGDQQVDAAAAPSRDLERVVAMARRQHDVAAAGQHLLNDRADLRLTLDHENGAHSVRARRRLRHVTRQIVHMFDARQEHLDRRSAIDFTVHEDRTAALVDDAIHGREAEPGALPQLLRRVERLEEMTQDRAVHADAGVADGEHHVRAGTRAWMLGGVSLVEFHVRGLDRQHAAARHRVAGVEREIEDHLFNLARIGADTVERVRRPRSQVDVFSDEPAQRSVMRTTIAQIDNHAAAGAACG